jgi:uncharacterized protein YaeQ
VIVYTYGSGGADMWWKQMESQVARFKNLTIRHIDPDTTQALAGLMQRNLDVQVSIQDKEISWNSGELNLSFMPEELY